MRIGNVSGVALCTFLLFQVLRSAHWQCFRHRTLLTQRDLHTRFYLHSALQLCIVCLRIVNNTQYLMSRWNIRNPAFFVVSSLKIIGSPVDFINVCGSGWDLKSQDDHLFPFPPPSLVEVR